MKEIVLARLVQAQSEFFRCTNCGRVARIRTPGDTYTCSVCGGRMRRT